MVEKTHKKIGSWRKVGTLLNDLYHVNLSFATWRDYAKGKTDLADPDIRALLQLGPRPCPSCGHKPTKRKRAPMQKRIRSNGYPSAPGTPITEVLNRPAPLW